LDPKQVFFIPGNHDAFNVKGSRWRILWRQRSLDNFYDTFPNTVYNTLGKENDACRYFWLDRDGVQLYLCLVDSSYLGDSSGLANFNRPACGRWLREQARRILIWYENGISGKLQMPDESGLIPAQQFRGALKILMMHHYLFKPPIKRKIFDPFLRIINNTVAVKKNILLADFDSMLCGHKHVVWTDNRTYAQHLDKRATNRILFTAFKRQFGITSSPLLSDTMGRRINRALSTFILMLARKFRSEQNEDIQNEDIPNLIERYLHDIPEFERQLKELCTDTNPDFEDLEQYELDEIVAKLSELTQSQRIDLARVAAKQLRDCKSALGSREFLHIMSGSSGKKTCESDHRAVNLYEIVRNNSQIDVTVNQFLWGGDTTQSSSEPWIFRNTGLNAKMTYEFKDSRRIPS
jgi:hypothetical protein